MAAGAATLAASAIQETNQGRSTTPKKRSLTDRIRRNRKKKVADSDSGKDLDAEQVKAKEKILHELSM